MYVRELNVRGLRNIAALELKLSPGCNVIFGENGAGKSSLLEAVFILTNGKTFRGGYRQSLVMEGQSGYRLNGHLVDDQGFESNIKVVREGKQSRIFLRNRAITNRSALVRHAPTLVFSQETLAKQIESAAGRRSLLDWCLFHVEPDYHTLLNSYRLSLNQYNASLRYRLADQGQWRSEVAAAGERLDLARQPALEMVVGKFAASVEKFSRIPAAELEYRRGWLMDQDLESELNSRAKDHGDSGYCSTGPHRCDLKIRGPRGDVHNWASRGQLKAYYYLLSLAFLSVVAETSGEIPIILVDDLRAEFDEAVAAHMLSLTLEFNGQVLVTGSADLQRLAELPEAAMFHVEQGAVRAV